jgi:hypothetical protein
VDSSPSLGLGLKGGLESESLGMTRLAIAASDLAAVQPRSSLDRLTLLYISVTFCIGNFLYMGRAAAVQPRSSLDRLTLLTLL